MKFHIKKMKTSYDNPEVDYFLGEEKLHINSLIGKEIEVNYEGVINCVKCGKRTKNSFGQGFCYTCFTTAPEAAPCIIRPELCEAHLGKGRDVEWEQKHHNRPHRVYLAVSSAIKVGITGEGNVATRWIDQGASSAIVFAETPNRRMCGEIEVAMKDHFTDKTNWRKMLKNDILTDVDLEEIKWEMEDILPSDLSQYLSEDDSILDINYPVLQFPTKVTSINLEKTPYFAKKLVGIKGQYLIFEDNSVINVRKYTGYNLELNY